MQIADIMTPSPITVKSSESVRRAFALLEDQDIRHLPVIDEDRRLVGVVSDRDLREYRLPVLEELDNPDQAEALLDTALSEVMSGDVISVDSGEDLVAACDLVIEYRIGAIPVLDRSSGELVGIVSYMDLLRVARDVLAAE